MKKFLAVLLAVLTVFSFATFSAAAEETTETETEVTGTLYEYSNGFPSINQKNPAEEVLILQDGDRLQFETITTGKKYEIVYYPDVVSIKKVNIKNEIWSQKAIDGKFEEITTFATSPNKYKSFYTTGEFVKGDLFAIDILGMGDVIATRDSAGNDRGEAAIDYELEGAKFVGWALYKFSSWSKSSSSKITIELYAVWDRTAGSDDGGEEGPTVDPTASPIQQALDTVIYYIDYVSNWIRAVPALVNTFFSMFISTKLKPWLYEIFGIESK